MLIFYKFNAQNFHAMVATEKLAAVGKTGGTAQTRVKVVLLLWYGDEYWSMFDVNLSHV
jgi:hypothetical protein